MDSQGFFEESLVSLDRPMVNDELWISLKIFTAVLRIVALALGKLVNVGCLLF